MTLSSPQYRRAAALIVLLCSLVGPLAAHPAPAQAQVAGGSGFASAVPCLSSPPTFATTSQANTILANGAMAPATDPALLELTTSSSTSLAPLGASEISGENSRIADGIGATYGLAYDDGSISGVRRLFAAAYLKRSVGLGVAGPGAIYEYHFDTNEWSLATTVSNVGSESRAAFDMADMGMVDQVGMVGLGDIEVAPDGRTLYAMNLFTRQVERYDLSSASPTRLAPLDIPFGLISADPAVQADLRPFALGFDPSATVTASSGPALVVGMIDSGARSVHKKSRPLWVFPTAYVLSYNTGMPVASGWELGLVQNLNTIGMQNREAGSTFFPNPRFAQTSTWNPWAPKNLVDASLADAHVRYPQPILTDITFTQDGQTMFVGLRDRSGDQYFSRYPPGTERSVMAQGDVLTYQLSGGTWLLQGDSNGDFFDDDTHIYPGSTPAHLENFMGAAAISLGGSGPSSFHEQLMATALLGAKSSGTRTYAATGGAITSQQTLHTALTPSGGKAATLGDVEVLCTYALIGGRLWQDTDGDSMQNTGEPAFPNLRLEVFVNQGATSGALAPPLASLSSDAQGNYLFAVPPNTPVNIRIAASSRATLAAQGWYFTDPNIGGNDDRDSDVSRANGYIELAGQHYGTVGGGVTGIAVAMPLNRSDQRNLDMGLTRVATVGEIGDRVWDDTDHDGVQDAGELGHAGLGVTLTADPSSAAILPGSYPKTTITDASGNYRFRDLPPGRYRVTFATPPAPFSATLRNVGGNDATDSDVDATTGYASPLITIDSPPNHRNWSIDLGLYGGTPDVWVSKSGPAQALVGGSLGYSLSYGNAGALPAAGVQLVDTLPTGVSYLSASPAPSGISGQTLTWSLGTLAAGQTGSVSLSVRAPASLGAAVSQAITNQARISTTTPNDPTRNNSSSSSGSLVRPEVGIAKTGPAVALVGDEFSYSLSYANTGSVAAAITTIADFLPAGVTLTRFIQNPGGACGYTPANRRVSCAPGSLAAGASSSVIFAAKADVTAAASVANTATISTVTAGDTPANNSSTATTAIQFPNPSVTIGISPAPFPVGEGGSLTATYRNRGTGLARSSSLTLSLPADVTLGALPGGCSYSAATHVLSCSLGDLAAGASGTRAIPLSLPASFAADQLAVAASIATATPERPADQGDNLAAASVSVVRPNVFVTAAGPASIVGQGSAFWYTLDYGNQHRANPSLTRAADSVMLTASLPADVAFVSADLPPSSVSGQTLTWDLGTLAPNASGQIHVVVQTSVPAGATLHFSADISTTTPGDDPSDNHAMADTAVIQPPSQVSQGASALKLAIHSDFDSNSRDGNPTNGVYISDGAQIAWPAGEVLDFTPRLGGLRFSDEPLPFPYEYRARVVGWSVAGFTVNGASRTPQAADSRGVAGCRAGARPASAPQRLSGCAYAYLGGQSRAAIASPAALAEAELATQAHAYWTQPPAPQMRGDVYLYTLDPLRSAQISVQVEVEVWIVNAAPGAIGGMPLPEIPVVPLPDPARQLISQDFTVNLLVPRSVVGPGSR